MKFPDALKINQPLYFSYMHYLFLLSYLPIKIYRIDIDDPVNEILGRICYLVTIYVILSNDCSYLLRSVPPRAVAAANSMN